jgi:hypothetical protein
MDDIKNDYIPADLPNVFLEREKDLNKRLPITTEDLKIHEFIFPLMQRLTKVRPQWKFIATRAEVMKDNKNTIKVLDAYDSNIRLGRIYYDYKYGERGDVICVANNRISDKMLRRSEVTTKDTKKAFKAVVDNFYAPTMDELSNAAFKDIRNAVYRAFTHNRTVFEVNYNNAKFKDALLSYVMSNWEQVSQALTHAGIGAAVTDNMQEHYTAFTAARDTNEIMEARKGSHVYIRDARYIVTSNNITKAVDTDELPPHMKQSIGLLKLVGDGTHVAGHGVRAAENKFFITSEGIPEA